MDLEVSMSNSLICDRSFEFASQALKLAPIESSNAARQGDMWHHS
jgi:hypothetical protein